MANDHQKNRNFPLKMLTGNAPLAGNPRSDTGQTNLQY